MVADQISYVVVLVHIDERTDEIVENEENLELYEDMMIEYVVNAADETELVSSVEELGNIRLGMSEVVGLVDVNERTDERVE